MPGRRPIPPHPTCGSSDAAGRTVTKISQIPARLGRAVIALLAGAALALSLLQIGTRYFAPGLSVDWGDEVVVYLLISAVFLSLGSLTAEGRHVRADVLLTRLPAGLRHALTLLACLAGIAFSAILCRYGVEITLDALALDERSTSSLRFPLWIYYAALPAGAALMAGGFTVLLWREAGAARR